MNNTKMTPIISVLCQAYNHGEFIEQCLNGIMMQETDFTFEVLIHDDASTDNTADIIKRFELQYPKIIKPIYQTINQYSKNKKVFSRIQLPRAKYKYIAICEGDDYWTDSMKLQKQVDFLEANDDFVISHHNVKVIYEDSNVEHHLSNPTDQKEVSTLEDLAHRNYIINASCVFRNKLFDELPDWFSKCPVADYPLHMLNAQFGKIKYFPDVMGVYRVHKGGVWQNKSLVYRSTKHVEMIEQMKYHFPPETNRILVEAQNRNAEFLVTHFKNMPENCKHYSLLLLENDPAYIANLLQNIQLSTNSLSFKNQLLEQQNTLTQLFIQTNSDVFREETSLKQIINGSETNLSFRFLNQEKVTRLRFDPINGYVVLTIKNILLIKQGKTIVTNFKITTNSNHVDGQVYHFDTNDPQIFIDLEEKAGVEIDEVIIELKYDKIGSEALTHISNFKEGIIKTQ